MMTKHMRAKFEEMEILFIRWTFLTQVLHIRVNVLTKLFGRVALPAIPFHPSPCSWVSSSQTHLPFNHHYLCSLNCLGVPLSKKTKEVTDERLTHGEQYWKYSGWYTIKCYTKYNGNTLHLMNAVSGQKEKNSCFRLTYELGMDMQTWGFIKQTEIMEENFYLSMFSFNLCF